MAKDSKIEWTHHTFNPWWGCIKVSPACNNCYAEAWAKRVGSKVWGPKAPRRFFSDAHWKEPLKWNREAEITGKRYRVFCASMADVFERKAELRADRERLWDIIAQTPQLDWLMLTKRPQNIKSMAPWDDNSWPLNVWMGTTVENQHWVDKRVPFLAQSGARIKFLSCEPLLGHIDLSDWMKHNQIDWVIAGGESGAKSRPMSPQWVRSLRDQCQEYKVAFHFKQWGHWAPVELLTSEQKETLMFDGFRMAAAGKKIAGRDLDERTWDEFPKIA
ncbi:phage Gp37/Gp68 family protein [Ruficoccus sp. ZRK36]|uniref:DUF5131 family protein n=1 Tax=Ruficoccus sp. ZRK36 TaxID=2866311 RepID=UPI001C736F2C|nr:phage Gp37/Gp68 family protein [Ruficoccus sp. ZRK36]QYY34817.1 phage Gp37/Gp68 family protein [Ruficoccus sp. ZRK36]